MKNILYLKNKELYKNTFMQQMLKVKKVNSWKALVISVMVIFLMISVGCTDDFLDKQQLNSLAAENFWTTEKDATMGVMGCYDMLQSTFIYNGDHVGCNFGNHLDGLTDNAVYRWTWQWWEGYSRNIVSSTNWFFEMQWITTYQAIARCNEAITRISDMTEEQINADASKRLLAEAKFIRALMYSNLVSGWHDVPLVTEIQLPTNEPAKSDRASIVGFIQDDLLACVNDLPESITSDEWGRVGQGAAYTLLAKLNLFNINNGGTYEKAAEYAENAMGFSYSLFNDYEKLFKDYNEINDEVVFPVVFVRGSDDSGSNFVGSWAPAVGNYWMYPLTNLTDEYYCTDGKPIKDPATGTMNPLYNPNNIWENRDPRLVATIVGQGALWNGRPITAADMGAEPTGLAFRKWREEAGHLEDRFDSPQDFYIFRYAHVLLMRAEALIMSGQHTHSDVNMAINTLRSRVGMPSVEDAEAAEGALTRQEYIDLIRHEWRVETAFEGWRYFNLVRWGQLEEAYKRVNEIDHPKFPSAVLQKVYAPRLESFPIPQTDLDNNSNLVQNPLW